MIKFLLCKPTFYGVKYEINPWMDIEKSPSWVKANSQWNKLKTVISKCKAKIHYLNPSSTLPDMVFTANAGILKGDTFLPSKNGIFKCSINGFRVIQNLYHCIIPVMAIYLQQRQPFYS